MDVIIIAPTDVAIIHAMNMIDARKLNDGKNRAKSRPWIMDCRSSDGHRFEYSWPSNCREHLSNDDAKVKNL